MAAPRNTTSTRTRPASKRQRRNGSASVLATAHRQAPIELGLSTLPATASRADTIVVSAFADGTLPPSARALDEASNGKLSALIAFDDPGREAGSSLVLHDLPGIAARRVLVVALGRVEELDADRFRKAVDAAAKALTRHDAKQVTVTLAELDVPGHSLAWRIQHASRALIDGSYRFNAPVTGGKRERPTTARRIELLVSDATPELEEAVRRGQAIADGIALAKDLGNLPPNVCTPEYFEEVARALGLDFGVEVEVLGRGDMAELGMGAALAVGRASAFPCRLIIMRYRGRGAATKPIVLVGKGVTFDTGGISLKPGEDLDMMKYDMGGAGSVFGALRTVARLQLPLDVIGIVGAVENMPGGNASRPGDVVTSMSGQTIEILNTDAEGRLVLCDALTYAERFDPAWVIDIATLTGACVIALGTQTSGLFANDDGLAEDLLECASDTGDPAWRLPLWDVYQEQLKSNFADMSNIGGRPAGAITAACFLARFARAFRWAHLDIAGTASVGGVDKGATGRPVPLLCEFLLRRADEPRDRRARHH